MQTYEPHYFARLDQLKKMQLASFPRRAVAFVLDFLAAFLLFLFILIYGAKLLAYMGLMDIDSNINLKFDLKNWYSILFIVLYFGLFTYWGNGKTPGKWLMKIRVVSLTHGHISLWHAIERALEYGASALELGFGFLQYFIHPNKQTVHDRIAETIVIEGRTGMSKKSEQYSRRRFLSSLGGAALALPLLESSKRLALTKLESAKPRNIIFILCDDHRYDFFGFMGKPKFLRTPNFDRLAQQGTHLQNAFVTTSLCSPSRASILTGKYSFTHGVVDNDSPMPPGNVFFPTYLQEAGYKTAFIGKWHMGNHTDEPQPGFNRWVSFPGQGVYYDPEFNIDGTRKKHTGYITDLLTDYALQWINAERKDRFFLYLSHKAVHAMFEPAQRHLGKYEKVALEYPATMASTEANYHNKPRWVRAQRNSWHGVDYMYHGEMDFDAFYRRYCETFLAVDDSIGRVVETLKKNDLLESTLILYTSDNGFSFGEHGLIDKRQMYEESMRIPLLAHCPELIKPNTKRSEFIQNVDFAPTILEAAGYQAPDDMEGRSFLSLLQAEKTAWRDTVFYVYYWERSFPHTPTVFGIRTAQYKYMTYHGIWDVDELYDIQRDPEERENLIDKDEHKELILTLRKSIYDWLEEKNGLCIPVRRSGLWQAAESNVHFDH